MEPTTQTVPVSQALAVQECRVLGRRVHALSKDGLIEAIRHADETRGQLVIASLNMHGIYTALEDPGFTQLHEGSQTLVHIDGTPIIWMGKLKQKPIDYSHRTGCIDWVPQLFQESLDKNWRIFHLGSTGKILQLAMDKLAVDYPGLVFGGRDGFFDAEPGSPENQAVIDTINSFKPNVLLVGMGMGRQENWILQNRDALDVPVIVTTGAMIQLIAGTLKIAPRWMSPLGIEWAYRLIDDVPGVSRRYLVEPWLIGRHMTANWLRKKLSRSS